MSTKSHIIYEPYIEIYEECLEPQSIFGRFTGYNVHFIVENTVLKSFKLDGEYIEIELHNTTVLPNNLRFWGDAILTFDWDIDGLLIIFQGGHHITKMIIDKNFTKLEKNEKHTV